MASVSDLYDYAEVEKGLDPIGGGDIIGDFIRFAIVKCEPDDEIDVMWQQFVHSDEFKQYGLEPW